MKRIKFVYITIFLCVAFKAKPRMSLVRGSLAGTDPFELPAGLKDLQKRMSTFPDAGKIVTDC